MAKTKSRTKCLVVSSAKRMDIMHPIFKEAIESISADIQLELFLQENSIVSSTPGREKNLRDLIKSSDLILVDAIVTSNNSFFEVGFAKAMGKPIVFLGEDIFTPDFPDFIRQSYLVVFSDFDDLKIKLKRFFKEFAENPKRFSSKNLIGSGSSSQIIVDLDKLDQREFENLCFELLSRLGYKQLEWMMKEEFIDAVTTLRKRDPDGFEYEEFWLISFHSDFPNRKLDILLNDSEYFAERIYKNLLESDLPRRSSTILGRADFPITILFVLRGRENYPKRLIKDIARRDFLFKKPRSPFTIRIRWWDDQIITSLVQNNTQLARKYFSTDALNKSGVRLSYEELYKQNSEMYEELEKTNETLIEERNKIEALERDAAWKLLSFTAAHRLGNPMDAIDSELSNLKLALSMGQKPEMINQIVESMELPVEKAKSIISQFRNLSTAHEIKPETVKQEKLNEILKNATKQASDRNVKVILDFKDIPDISVDIQKLSECFEEIVRNAMHFVKGDHQQISITLSVAKEADLPDKIDRTSKYVKIVFSDNGCGVPNEKKKEIFKPFERGYIHGTGLGLAFCEIIIQKHGGVIRENGKHNVGAVFEIFLPIKVTKQIN